MNTSRLKGKIVENNYNFETFSKAISMNHSTLCRKLNNKSEFTASEIERIRNVLNLSFREFADIFFEKENFF